VRVTLKKLKAWQGEGKKVAIFGAGCFGKYAADILARCGVIADCFVDNNPDKWGHGIYRDIICLEPQVLAHKDEYITFICINLERYDEIEKSARNSGIIYIASFGDVIDDIIINRTEVYMELIHEFANLPYAEFFYTRNPNRWAEESCQRNRIVADKIAVYTGIFGDYDNVYTPKRCPKNIDYYFISDECPNGINPFCWIDAKKIIPDNIKSPIKRNRYIKMHPHRFFPQYKYSIYIDGNFEILEDISSFIHINNSGISVFMHPRRECIFYEGITIVNFRRVVVDDVCKQMGRYLQEGMPLDTVYLRWGLWQEVI